MKKLKILLLGLVFLLATGCSVDYSLNFKGNHLSEKVDISSINSNMTMEEIRRFIEEHLNNGERNSSYNIRIYEYR